MKKLVKILSVFVILTLAVFAAACASGTTVREKPVPTAAQVVEAREQTVAQTEQGYNFTLDFSGNFNVLGFGASLGGKYDAKYRYNKESGDLKFMRSTSGELLFDSTAYVYSSDSSRIKVVVDENGKAKRASVVRNEGDLGMINLPIEALVDSLSAAEYTNIKRVNYKGYEYSANLNIKSNNVLLNAVLGKIGSLGTKIFIKGARIDNPVNGLIFYFNLSDGMDKLDDFMLEMNVDIPIKAVKVNLNVKYAQKASSAPISIPSTAGIITSQADMAAEIAAVNAAAQATKNDPAYSLDLLAKNELDPSWKKLAIVDSYTARMYKNTEGSNVWFDHSYMFKSHTEEEGKETFKYTLGNLQDGTVHLVSYKGSNSEKQVSGVTADTQYDYMTSPFLQEATDFDCVRKTVSGSTVTYNLYLTAAGAREVQNRILAMINSNVADGVTEVNNYFNADNTVKSAEIEIIVQNGKLIKSDCKTEIVYHPLGGDYTDYNVNLKNVLTLKVNDKLSEAQKYTAPKKALAALHIGDLKYLL